MLVQPIFQYKANYSFQSGYLNNDPFFVTENGDFSSSVVNNSNISYGLSGPLGGFVRVDNGATCISDNFFVVNPDLNYRFDIKCRVPSSVPQGIKIIPYILSYDYKLNLITSPYIYEVPSTQTSLAVDLVSGATTVQLTSAANWDSSGTASVSGFRVWRFNGAGEYTYNLDGREYPEYTYSRELYTGLWGAGAISGNVITLTNPWGGPTIPAGSKVSNSSATSTHVYPTGVNTVNNDNTWATFSSPVLSGVNVQTYSSTSVSMYGAAYCRLGVFILSRADDSALLSGDLLDVGGIGLRYD